MRLCMLITCSWCLFLHECQLHALDYGSSTEENCSIMEKTFSWLVVDKCEVKNGKNFVTTVSCQVCRKHESKIKACKNFSERWCSGTDNICLAAVETYEQREAHKSALHMEEWRQTTFEKTAIRQSFIKSQEAKPKEWKS